MSPSHPPIDWDALSFAALAEELAPNQRWTTWNTVERTRARGPQPWPDWLVTSDAAVDTDLGVLKTGKEADVHLIERAVPKSSDVAEAGSACLLAAKRYRSLDHRLFHRDASYTEGRRSRKSRDNRAMARKTEFGRAVESRLWANAEFGTLKLLWQEGVPVPYPVQIDGREILMEFIGTGTTAAPRLAQLSPDPRTAKLLWGQLVDGLIRIARLGFAHGDLSPYNILVRDPGGADPRAVIIDVPQIVDLASNPRGADFLLRDCHNVASWFARHGLDVDADSLFAELMGHAW